MTDKGSWGGRREGAGRKPQKVRIGKFSIQAGQEILVNSVWPEGRTAMRKATVELAGGSRNRTIKLHCEDGEIIMISMFS